MDTGYSNSERELSAIFFADIVGYTSMMEADEASALNRLNHYQNVLKDSVDKFDGRIIKNYGDGSLLLFQSTLKAIQCAQEVQLALNSEPTVPLRIGLHLGDVTHIEGDAYSSDINLASRVESLGISGAVLVSGDFYDKVKNQRGFEFQSLGKFHFKNIKKEKEVYALANPGISVPDKKQLQGKLEPPRKRNTIPWFIIGVLVIAGVLVGAFGFNSNSAPLSEEEREKRIAVLNFQNQTLNPELDMYGNMISDWLTKGLMETGEANIINSANIQSQIEENDPGQSPNPDFYESTGVDMVLEGRYYLAEANLFIVANFIDVQTGKVLHFIQLEGGRDDYMDLLKKVTDQITSYWMVKDNVQLRLNPPTYEAYQEWIEGEKIYTTNAAEAITKYENAFLKDTTFYPPLFRLISLYSNQGNSQKMEEIMTYLSTHESSLTKYEKLDFKSKKYILEHNYAEGAKVTEEKYKMDPSDFKANYNAAYLNNLARNYEKTIEVLNDFDPRFIKDVGFQKEWRLSAEAHAYYQMKDYQKVLKLADENPEARFFTPYVVHHMMALIQLDSLNILEKEFEKYTEKGTYEPSGKLTPHDQMLIILCSELKIAGKTQLLEKYVGRLDQWVDNGKVQAFNHSIPDLFNNLPLREKEIRGFAAFFIGKYQLAITHWLDEIVPESNWPDRIERASRIGVCHALMGDEGQAVKFIEKINDIKLQDINLKAIQQYYSSRIYSALGDNNKSITLIKEAISNGFMFSRPMVMEHDPFMMSNINDKEFQAIIRPNR